MDNFNKYKLNTLNNNEWLGQIDKINKEHLLKFTLFNKKFNEKIKVLVKQITHNYNKSIIINDYIEKTIYWILKLIKINIPSILNKITFIIINKNSDLYKTFLPCTCSFDDNDIYTSKTKHNEHLINFNFTDITKPELIKFNNFLIENKINLIYLGFINKHISNMKKFLSSNFNKYSIKKINCDKFTSYILRSK